jgi:hypothetical protein
MTHQSRRIGSGVVPARCVFKINEEHRDQTTGRETGTKHLLMHMMHEMFVHMLYFYFKGTFRVLFANFEILIILSHMEIISSNISEKKKYIIVNHYKRKGK